MYFLSGYPNEVSVNDMVFESKTYALRLKNCKLARNCLWKFNPCPPHE